jgi:hypothetical protein
MFDEKMRMEADTMSYVQAEEASSNEALLTPQYIQLHLAKSLVNNTKERDSPKRIYIYCKT